MIIMRRAAVSTLLLAVLSASGWSAKVPFTFDAMMRLVRVDDPQLSPDGKLVAFTGQTVDMASNTKPTQIYVVPSSGGVAVKITTAGSMNTRPRWSPDSKRLYFVSNRPNAGIPPGVSEIWSQEVDGTDARIVTTLPTGGDGVTLSPDGQLVLFTSDVYPGCEKPNAKPGEEYDAACNLTNHEQEEASKMNARTYTSLLYRHWTQYQGRTRRHLLIETLNDTFKARDLTPGDRDTPPFSLGGPDGYAFSPDSVQIAYVTNTDPDLSTSTNSDIYLMDAAGGVPKKLTVNPGADEGPVFSPDGRSIAYRTQLRAGFESDQWRLSVLDIATGVAHPIADQLDRWVSEYVWSADSKRLFFTIEEHGTEPLLMAPVAGGEIRTIAQGPTSVGSMRFSRDDKMMIYTEQSGSGPPEIKMATSRGGAGVALTHLNDEILSAYQLTPLERLESDGADGTKVQSFIVKPPDFDPAKHYPVLFLIHGGPQGDWGESWSYRWNPQVFAAAGYVVVMPNPHGSTGYGQAFTDAVSGDWGGRAYGDIMAAADNVATLPYVDKDHMVAAGGSYGGYMIDWILGHSNRFKALVSHAGVYDLRSEAGTTDELWFVKWEFKGFPWEKAASYDEWSPNASANNFHTPTLVTQGELDYRVPVGQSQELFTALQEHGVPSKLVLFPDEGHWVLKPQNSQYWYSTVIDWLDKYAKPAAVKSSK
jgi:dipeptidyl aminopeptidase/acylaminoacyl peptidase